MTALAGLWHWQGKPAAGEACRRMLAAQRIYGPHDEAAWSDGAIAMGRCLFRTVPEDAFDRQPLHGAGGRLTLVADVRLDNRDELASALRLERAERLSDAAMLLAVLERWGVEAIDHLAGDFAFALWDAAEQTLTLARDFLGQRPLHYHRGRDFFAFASMPKGLHALPEIPYAPDEEVMAEFVTLMPVGETRSFFAGIELVAAGHVTTVTRERVTTRRHWQPDRRDPPRSHAGDYVEGLRHYLDQATRARLRGAGEAVGAHLSAGFDSAAVCGTAARLLAPGNRKVVAFTAVPREDYDGPAPEGRLADEGPLAAASAAMHPNIEHVLIRSGHRSPLEDLDRNFHLFDRPALNPCNMVWAAAIAGAARERKLPVVLTGQMGNMTISYSGSERLAELLVSGRLITLARESLRAVSRGTMSWKGALSVPVAPFVPKRLWEAFKARRGQIWDVTQYTAIHPERLREMDLERVAKERDLDFSYRPWSNGFDVRLWVLRRTDPGNYGKGYLAGWGIDHRDPTADKRLVEYCLAVPMAEYLRDGETRSLGRRALGDRVPQAVLYEKRKGYQAADWHEGLAAGRELLEDEVARLAPCAPAARTLDVDRLRRLVAEWPASGWEQSATMSAYRLALLRGLSAGHFLRKVAGSNQ